MEQAQEFMHLPKILGEDDFYINEEVTGNFPTKNGVISSLEFIK